MHLFWVWVYDRTEHLHRDPVANVVIYAALAFFGACLGLIFGVPAFVLLREDFPCVAMSINGVDRTASTMDSCHFIVAFSLAIYTMLLSCLGIAAGETHKPLIYSIFGGFGFVGCWAELYSFTSLITQTAAYENRVLIYTLDNAPTVLAMCAMAVAGHGIALLSLLMAVRNAWKINFHFTRQEKLIYAERLRQKKALARGGGIESGMAVADIDDDHEFVTGGMEKSLKKMYDAKKRTERSIKKKELEQIREQEEDERVIAEQKGNVF